jgi:pheromone shutdown protein TraB
MENKFLSVLTSRKAWAATLAILTVFGVDAVKDLSPDVLAGLVATVAGVYMGSVAVEDGLSALAEGLMQLRQWWDKTPPTEEVVTDETVVIVEG